MEDLETDIELVDRVLAGDASAFTVLVRRYQGPLYNAAYRVTGHAEDARDVAQSAFLKVAQHLDEYDRRYKFFSWIFRIAVNEAINLVDRRRPEDPMQDGVEFEGPVDDGPEARYARRQRSDLVQQALAALSPQDRAVLTLRHFAECSYEEIAEILVLEEKTVRSRLHEARRRLALRLDGMKVR